MVVGMVIVLGIADADRESALEWGRQVPCHFCAHGRERVVAEEAA